MGCLPAREWGRTQDGWHEGSCKGVKAEQGSLLSGTCSAEGGQDVLGEPQWAGILLSVCVLIFPGLIHITHPCAGQVGDVQWMHEVSSSLSVPPFIPQRGTSIPYCPCAA